MSKTTIVVLAVAIILIAAGVWYFFGHKSEVPVAQATFSCDAGKTIAATFYKNSVKLVLSDGRTLTEPQVISADGARYANSDESFVFWNKGNTAFITEGSVGIQTFSNCVAPNANGQTVETYASLTLGYSIQYPQGYTLSDSFTYPFSAKKPIHGVSFTVPAAMATGTNLGSDTYVSVEELPRAKLCTGDIFLTENVKAYDITENGVAYSVASSTGAGAGNRYEETVYALPGSNPCTAVRYFIHYGVIDNYPPGTVQAFDESALLSDFDTIRQSLVLTR